MTDKNNSASKKSSTDERSPQTECSYSTTQEQALNLTRESQDTGPAVLKTVSTNVYEHKNQWIEVKRAKSLASNIANDEFQCTAATSKKGESATKTSQCPAEEMFCMKCMKLKDENNKCKCNYREANYSQDDFSENSDHPILEVAPGIDLKAALAEAARDENYDPNLKIVPGVNLKAALAEAMREDASDCK